MMELTFYHHQTTRPQTSRTWDLVDDNGNLHPPPGEDFAVTADGIKNPIIAIGFKRRVFYAPVKQRDLRIGNYLYLQLSNPVPQNQTVQLANPTAKLWPANQPWKVIADSKRLSPMIHVNQVGYMPDLPKKAQVGYYLGSLGEAGLFGTLTNFALIQAPMIAKSFTEIWFAAWNRLPLFKLWASSRSRLQHF